MINLPMKNIDSLCRFKIVCGTVKQKMNTIVGKIGRREQIWLGKANIVHEPLISREKIILPPFLIKQFVKALVKNGNCFNYICQSFPGLSREKLIAGVFNGQQIHRLINNNDFTNHMTQVESIAWTSFVLVVKHFLGSLQMILK